MEDEPQDTGPSLLLNPPGGRPTWAEIDLDNLIHNYAVMREAVGTGVAILAAVKADAYGHGAVQCARALASAGVDWFGVALVEEAVALRDSGIIQPILCLAGFWEGQERLVLEKQLTPAVFEPSLLDRLDRAARESGRVAAYHLKVDTGMGRLGVPYHQINQFLDGAERLGNVRLDGVMTHHATADDPSNTQLTQAQMARFAEAVELVRARGHTPRWIHQANGALAHAHPRALGNLVRLGGVLYGLWRDTTNLAVPPLDWRPVMSLHSRVMFIKTVPAGVALGYGATFITSRESRIATLPIGYRDGLRRLLSNRGKVLIRGRFAPIVGRVSMDLTMVDVTEIPDACVSDEAVILGGQGAAVITAEEVAAQIGTLSYEVTCGISERVPRVLRKRRLSR